MELRSLDFDIIEREYILRYLKISRWECWGGERKRKGVNGFKLESYRLLIENKIVKKFCFFVREVFDYMFLLKDFF